jgi:hypothetical protein
MIGTIILRIFLFSLFVLILSILFITFLNRRSAKADSKLYDPDYKPDDLSDYETHESIETEANPRSTGYYRLDLKRK